MKNAVILTAVAAWALVAGPALAEDTTYVGAQKCQICHRTEKQGQQYTIWEQSKHAKAFEALSKPEAAAKAKALDVAGNPAESPVCQKCHAPLCEKAPELKAEGVSCEVCHGPGSAYKKLSVMKDKDEAVKNGLVLYGSPDKIKALCLKCHANAHGTTFDFDASWAKIKHPVPKG
ncbi:MAG: multiheme c-type cytochrome [Candidatus Aminicenantales bacterium]